MFKILYHSGLLLYCLFIYWLSSHSSIPAPMWFPYQDKLYHAGAYFILGALIWTSLRCWIQTPIILTLFTVFLGGLYGISDEWHQSFVPGREVSAEDWLADFIGVSMAVFFCKKYTKPEWFS